MKLELPLPAGPVRLRRLREVDLDAFLSYRSDPEVGRYQGWAAMDCERARDFLREVSVPGAWSVGEWDQIGIARSDDDALVGDIGLLRERPDQLQIGISLARSAQGRGWARAALLALFAALPEQRLRAIADARNGASLHLFQALGFVEVDRESVVVKGEACIDVVMERAAAPTSTHSLELP